MRHDIKSHSEVVRLKGRLKEIVTIKDDKGNILHRILNPVMIEFYPRDVVQVMIGATVLAIPIAFTEEVWNLGQSLPLINTILIGLMSILFISLFVYYNYYRQSLKGHIDEFFKRTVSTYIAAFIIVAVILTLIQRAPWQTDWLLAIKRIVIISFPASMSAAITDVIK